MKIQCDVCEKEAASVFCTADEAALCGACDHRVHHANKLASKHQRFSLLHPSSSKQVPLCDICQEKRGFVFCVQDRAILWVKLSATSALYDGDSLPQFNSQTLVNDPFSVSPASFNPSSAAMTTTATAAVINKNSGDNNLLPSETCASVSSISDYLIEMLPGWHVEDFLDSGFSKSDDGLLPFVDADLERNTTTFSPESSGLWVPQHSPSSLCTPHNSSQIGGQTGWFKETIGIKANRRWTDDSFTVPVITPPSTASKRFRPLS
ncbi:hypothetical protein ES319_D02G111200v1 [Gossypium barbadense]|uniref:B box-type domain-containing protein n=1 Tax=Gossypium barbadense TaxID=3634 RepID=A0A5J5SB19_GOSBA|nr:hypothetical protein ES319_D02G111200v1 [Gossypium barbadense]